MISPPDGHSSQNIRRSRSLLQLTGLSGCIGQRIRFKYFNVSTVIYSHLQGTQFYSKRHVEHNMNLINRKC